MTILQGPSSFSVTHECSDCRIEIDGMTGERADYPFILRSRVDADHARAHSEPEPQPIHERYVDKLCNYFASVLCSTDEPFIRALLREMVEEVGRHALSGEIGVCAKSLGVKPGDYDLTASVRVEDDRVLVRSTTMVPAAMEGGSPTYTQGPVQSCFGCGAKELEVHHQACTAITMSPVAIEALLAWPKAERWSCPRCGTNPGGTKNALNAEDAKTGCFRCGSKLVVA
jgi:hypothetical protein